MADEAAASGVRAGRGPRPAIVFLDLDGCLVDSRSAISRCLNVGLEAVGAAPRAPEHLHRLIGPPLHTSFETLLGEAGLDAGLAPRCVAAYRDAYREVCVIDTVPIPGIPAALERLRASLRLSVVTSKPAAFAEPILEAVGLREVVEAVHAPDLEARAEPKATTLSRALRELAAAVAPAATVMVGDRHHDIDAGRACGTATLGVTWGIGEPEELAHADAIVHRPAELVDALSA
jgi:phosphoglycolate phosphatase